MSSTVSKRKRRRPAGGTSKSARAASARSGKGVEMTPGGDNVFEDLGFGPAESSVLSLKADLHAAILRVVRERKLTQAQLAVKWDKPQPRVSEILTGKLHLVSIDTMISLLGAIGVTVEIVVGGHRSGDVA